MPSLLGRQADTGAYFGGDWHIATEAELTATLGQQDGTGAYFGVNWQVATVAESIAIPWPARRHYRVL